MVVSKQMVGDVLDVAMYVAIGMVAYLMGTAIAEQRQTMDDLKNYIERVERDFLFISSAPAKEEAHDSKPATDTVVPDVP